MALDDNLNQDRRAKDENVHVARGTKHAKPGTGSVSLTILDTEDTKSENFSGNGLLTALLIEHPTNDALTLTVEIFPQDIPGATGIMFSIATLAPATDHYIDIRANTTDNTPVYLFGAHTIKVTTSAVVTADRTIKVTPIIAQF